VHNVQLVKNIKYKNPTALIAISKASKAYAVTHLGAASNSISVVCHGVSKRYANRLTEQEQNNLRKQYGFSKSSFLIGFVGRITVEKGLDILIAAIDKHLAPDLKENINLVFLGDFYSEADELYLSRVIDDSKIKDQITMVPFQDPLPFYNIFDIFVLPSRSEAFGLVCVEAMLCGCCTIRTDTNGAEDQIAHGVDGFIFQNGDAKALGGIIQNLMENPAMAATVAENGRKKALEHFTIETMTKKTLEVYSKIV
jgi:glycosyltransferase involved in cell wall biosynthesis